MNDITLEWRYNSVKIWCRIIRKDDDKSHDDEYECDEKKDGLCNEEDEFLI